MPINDLGKDLGAGVRRAASSGYNALVSGASQNIEDAANTVSNTYSTLSELERPGREFKQGVIQGITGYTPPPAAAPAAPVVPKPSMAMATMPPRGAPSAAVAPVAPSTTEPQPAADMVTNNIAAAPAPGIRPSAVRAPAQVTDLPYDARKNSGPLGGLYSAALALSAGRAQNNAARAGMKNTIAANEANARAEESAGRVASTDIANKKGAFQLDREQQLATLDAQIAADDGKDPKKTKLLQQQRLAIVGKTSADTKYSVASYEEPLDPANPMAGTRKIPVVVDAQGNAKFIRPSQAGGNAQQLRTEADAAIAAGADPAKVKAKYQQMTGASY
jgi:hypothetical protein